MICPGNMYWYLMQKTLSIMEKKQAKHQMLGKHINMSGIKKLILLISQAITRH